MQLKNSMSQHSPVKAVLSPIKTSFNQNSKSTDIAPSNAISNKSRNILDQIGNLVSAEANFNEEEESTSPVKSFGSGDTFAFKLTQIQPKNEANDGPTSTGKSPSKKQQQRKYGELCDSIDEKMKSFNEFLIEQRKQLPQLIANSENGEARRQVLDQFFELVQREHSQITQSREYVALINMKNGSPTKSPTKSPVKSPSKMQKENMENISPIKEQRYASPTKEGMSLKLQQISPQKGKQEMNSQKENRKSQQRKQKALLTDEGIKVETSPEKEENLSSIYLSEINESDDGKSESSNSSNSPLKPCPKSPLKRMKTLEQQENLKDLENIETTYKKSPERSLTLQVNKTDTVDQDINEEPVQQSQQPESDNQVSNSLLKNQQSLQEPSMTCNQQEESTDITHILDVDSNVINYGQFICGKILGSTLLLTNISQKDQIVTMSISKDKIYECDTIFGQYNREELPFDYSDGSKIANSELEYNCWFIENPVSKELQKSITLKIGPQMSQEFIVVVKAPKNKLQSRVVSFVDIEMTESQFGTDVKSFEKHLNHDSGSYVTKEAKICRKIDVLLLGYLDNPKIKCIKQLFNQATNSELVSLAVKKTQGIQKFKLPFKNLSSYLDSDVEFAFIRTQNIQQNDQLMDARSPEGLVDAIDCFSFYCQPNQLKINAEQVSILTVQIKVNTDLLLNEEKVDQKLLKCPLNKLLVARLKNSQVLFSFFVSITLVE